MLEKTREAKISVLHASVVAVVQERMPDLAQSVAERVAIIDDETRLLRLLVRMSTVPDAEQAMHALLDALQEQ